MPEHANQPNDPPASAPCPLLADLTEPQAQAVAHVDGPLLVLAGPGSGKTRVITRRVAHLVLEVGIPPWNVLAITFTNKAAGEMQQRASELLSPRQARAITISTFHSLCARLLRLYADRLNLPSGYSIYDTADQKRAIKQALEDLEINSKNFPPANMLSSISHAKNELIDAETFTSVANDFYARTVARVYRKYEQILRRNNALDFDDLLLKTVELFKQHRDVLEELQERYQYILIDEYQDTNHAQFMIASALAAKYKNICATGDPDQSIYGWRGANIRNILEFETHYPDAKVVRLEQNYRSTQNILAAADGLIRNNARRKHKRLWTENAPGETVSVVTCYDERQEADWIVQQMRQRHDDDDLPWGGMAVFYRVNSLSRVIEDALRTAGIPYQVARGTAFYDRAEIKNVVAYLRATVNPADEVSILRVINTPTRGIGDRSIKAMQAFALAHNQPIDDVIRHPAQVGDLGARAVASIGKFAKSLDAWRTEAGLSQDSANLTEPRPELSLRGFVEKVIRDSGLHAFYEKDQADPDEDRLANLGEFVSFAQQFEQEYAFDLDLNQDPKPPTLEQKLLALLERVSLISDVDAVDPDQGSVTLMTLHAAKGLEFPLVAMIAVEDGLLPHERANSDPNELEEERRLCFVGITRAMHKLLLTQARYRTVFGQTMPTVPSRFLRELPREVLDEQDISEQEQDVLHEGLIQRDLARKQAMAYAPGTLVRHPDFGLGRVVSVSPMGAHTRARINFNTAGPKTLILQYARLQVVQRGE
jgi:DNA helicase-2/ATP-dependent DNA helicase PcrA